MLTADGRLLRPVSRRYADHLEFLRSANDHLANTNVLVVVTTNSPLRPVVPPRMAG